MADERSCECSSCKLGKTTVVFGPGFGRATISDRLLRYAERWRPPGWPSAFDAEPHVKTWTTPKGEVRAFRNLHSRSALMTKWAAKDLVHRVRHMGGAVDPRYISEFTDKPKPPKHAPVIPQPKTRLRVIRGGRREP